MEQAGILPERILNKITVAIQKLKPSFSLKMQC